MLIIFAIFHLTFSENLFYLSTVIPDGAFKDVNTFSSLFVDTEYEEDEEGNISGANSIKSPGVFLQGLVEELGELVNGAREVRRNCRREWYADGRSCRRGRLDTEIAQKMLRIGLTA